MEPEEFECFRALKKDEKKSIVPSLLKNLEERSLGCIKKNVSSKEYRELIAEELLVAKTEYDELRCEMPGMPRSTFLMVFSPDGTKVASTHGNHNIHITDIRSGKNLKTLVGHPRTPWCIAFHPTSNQIVASGCLGGQVRIWDLSGGSEVWTAKNQTVIASIAFHPLERMLVIATSNEVYFWDWSKPEPFLHASTGSQKEKVRYVAFDKLGHRLITGISNSHSRWEYVRSSERASEHPVRHFNIASRRPVFRRGLFPVRQNVSLPTSNNEPRETRSRVPERERNITMSYRNLVRQYGRLVQRYLQLYRPPAMIDRGTDPMENTGNIGSDSTAETQDTSNLVASNPTNALPQDQPSTSDQSNPQNEDNSGNPAPCETQSNVVQQSRKHKSDSSPENQIPQKKLKTKKDDNGDQPTTRSESPQPGTSGLSNPKKQSSIVAELSRAILEKIANIGSNKKTGVSSQAVKTANNGTKNNQSSSAQTEEVTVNEGENQQSLTYTGELIANIIRDSISQEVETSRTDNDGLGNQEGQTENQQTNLQTVQPLGNSNQNCESNSQDCNVDNEELIENTSENNQGPDVQTENIVENCPVSSSSNEHSLPETSRDEPFFGDDVVAWIRSLNSPSQELPSATLNPGAETSEPQEADESLGVTLDDTPNANDPVPVPSGGSDELVQHGEDPTLENMMMNMRRNAEDNLRARLMPFIRNRVPESEREDILRLFEQSVRESREQARLRYRNMGNMYNRQPSRGHVFTSSDSSSSEEERDPLHMNFYIRSRTDNNAGAAAENDSGAGPSTQRSRGIGFSSGNNSYHNINNLESWVTSLFNDVDSSSANNYEMNTDSMQPSNSRSANTSLLDLIPRINSETAARNRDNLNVSISTTTSSSPDSAQNSPPNPAGNTCTGTTNSTIYSQARRRLTNLRSAFLPTRTVPEFRRVRISPGYRRRVEGIEVRPLSNPAADANFGRDEVINFSELPNSENPTPERSESLPSALQDNFHPFNPPPNLPAINPENIGIGNMYSNIIHDLETSLSNARDIRTVDRPGEMSNMLSSFSNRLETLMNQSEDILRNLRTSVEVLPDNDAMEYGEEATVPTASFNDSSFFVRDQRVEGSGLGRNLNSSLGYDIRQNNATSDHTYPRNSESPSSSSNLNDSMSPLMNSLHMTLSHIQSQSRLLHRQVESIERIDRAMVEVSQLQLMRLLLVELSTYVRSRSGESRSTSMSSVRQMMAGTRISDSSPGNTQSNRDPVVNTPTNEPGPSTSTGSRNTSQNSSARSRGLTRKTYPPSRLNRPRELGFSRSGRHSRDAASTTPSTLPTVAPPHTFSVINVPTLVRIDRRLQSIIDDHSTRFSYLNELVYRPNSPRRLVHEVGEHTLALRLRESITRTNRLIGNIFNANVVRNYRIDSTTSLRHGIERYYERTLLSLIIDGISGYLDQNVDRPMPTEVRTRMQSVLQLAMVLSDLLLLYTIISLSPTTDVNLDSERRILATRIAESCSTMIRCRRSYSNVFLQSLRSLRLMVSCYCGSPYSHLLTPSRRGHFYTPERARNLLRTMRARRQRAQHQSNSNTVTESNSQPSRQTRNSTSAANSGNSPLINACLYLSRRQRTQDSSNSNQIGAANTSQIEDSTTRARRRNSTDLLINAYLTAGRSRSLNQSNPNVISGNDFEDTEDRNTSSTENRANRTGFNPYRDIALITSLSSNSPSRPGSSRSNDTRNRNSAHRSRIRMHMANNPVPNTSSRSENQNPVEDGRRLEEDDSSEIQVTPELQAWLDGTSEDAQPTEERNLFGYEPHVPPPLSPIGSRPSTSNNANASEPLRYWRVPTVQVNDIPVSDLATPLENSESDNNSSSNLGVNSNNSSYPRVMARLAAIRSVSVYNPMGVLRPRLLHPLYATLNPFDADLEQREHIYDSDVISTVTPNHRIQVWDISDSIIPSISDPLKNLVVRECKIHNDASVDIATDGSILVTLLPSGGYLNITNRLGVYSLRWETLGQCLYTTSFVHNAVSVSLSPLGRHLVVGLASRRVSILPNDRWMMASIFKIEEKDQPGDHLPFVRQIDRGTDERATSHKSVNCIRWLPTSGQGLIYATNTGQLNIWT
ncbi:uncharacterized protein LOC123310695 isoform X2 [Coccinella septempunctata]|uniref:uncharacterized protein LOC123310695 isoform X2 n=1 Tax=Coccinella septempunctata TaxID=41139 RepID=UPI001D06CB7B|nr:uncharacterized protein LOC123310695 isoform X2 [Coccinella septempunctata]